MSRFAARVPPSPKPLLCNGVRKGKPCREPVAKGKLQCNECIMRANIAAQKKLARKDKESA